MCWQHCKSNCSDLCQFHIHPKSSCNFCLGSVIGGFATIHSFPWELTMRHVDNIMLGPDDDSNNLHFQIAHIYE